MTSWHNYRFFYQLALWVVICSIILFAVFLGISMTFYPGGTHENHHTTGHLFWHNFFCDLTQPIALNGQDNLKGSLWAQTALIILAIGFIPFWWIIAMLFAKSRLRQNLIRVTGIISAVAMIFVPLTPSLRVGALHTLVIFLTGVPGLIAAVVSGIEIFSEKKINFKIRLLTGIMITAALINMFFYMYNVIDKNRVLWILPGMQKISGILVLSWMIFICFYLYSMRIRRAPNA